MRKIAIAALAMFAAALPAAAQQQGAPSANLRAERTSTLRAMAEAPLDLVVKVRRQCAAGDGPTATAKLRSYGDSAAADAADACAAALQLVGRNGQLIGFYRQMQNDLGGASTGHEQLPTAIGAAVVKTKEGQVPIGNGRSAVITAALAFDAGFTVAYGKGTGPAQGMPDLPVLKPIAERCLAQAEPNLGLCYSTGYVYGARAVTGLVIVAP